MGNWEADVLLAEKLLVNTFPDLFIKEEDYLKLANGIEVFNISAYGNVAIVDRDREMVFRVGEPVVFRDVLEVAEGYRWKPLVNKVSPDAFRNAELDFLLRESDIPLVFKNVSLFPYTENPVEFNRLNSEVCPDSRYLLVWGAYLGEAFWIYFSSLALRKCGVITGEKGLTNADLHGYFLRDYSPPIDYPYQWSLLMFMVKGLIVDTRPTFHTYGEGSEVVNGFAEEFSSRFGHVDVGIVVEAESTSYQANNHSKGSGIGQLREKYLGYDYQIGFVSGPGLSKSSLVNDEAERIGVISSTQEGEPVMLLPEIRTDRDLMSLAAKEFISSFLS